MNPTLLTLVLGLATFLGDLNLSCSIELGNEPELITGADLSKTRVITRKLTSRIRFLPKPYVPSNEELAALGEKRQSIVYKGIKFPQAFCKKPQVTSNRQLGPITEGVGVIKEGIGTVNEIIGGVRQGLESVLGIFNIFKDGFQGIYDMLKTAKDIIELLGFDKKDDVLLFDKICRTCVYWMKCSNFLKWHSWAEIDQDEGAVLKFTTRIPHDWNLIGLGKWFCWFQDKVKGKTLKVDVFGGGAPKYAINLIRISKRKIYSVDMETLRVDVGFKQHFW